MNNIIPEVFLFKFIGNILEATIKDFHDNGENSAIMVFFNENSIGNFDFQKEIANILNRDEATNQFLEVYLGFNLQRASASPSIHILLSSEQQGRYDALGNNAGGMISYENMTIENNAIYVAQRDVFGRSYSCEYMLMLTSLSSTQVVMMYHFLRFMLISFTQQLESMGMMNVKFTGSDVEMIEELVPPHVFSRVLRISFDYSIGVPSIELNKYYKNICVNLKKVDK